MKVRDLMTSDVKSCREYNTLNTAARMMWEHDVGCLPIVDHENHILGMLTDRDVCMSSYIQGAPLTGALVTSAMSKEVFSCRPDDELASVERLMRKRQVHRVPVVDAQGCLAAIIPLNDLAREAAKESQSKKPRRVSDAEITETIAAVCAPRHRIIVATQAAA
jgi:CBS-domain-containing membrane protein